MFKILKIIIIIAAALGAAIIFSDKIANPRQSRDISTTNRRSSETSRNLELKISTSTLNLETFSPLGRFPVGGEIPKEKEVEMAPKSPINTAEPKPVLKISESVATKEISSKSFEELINSSVIQLYCGNLSLDETSFSDISRGTGITISSEGNILTNRHIIYDENTNKIKNDCFVLKSPFPNIWSQKPKVYYNAEVINYPLIEKFSDSFSKDKYYNDFAVLKIISKIDQESKINLLLGFDFATPEDYLILENDSAFNFLPIDWNYQPKDGDTLITLGYGVDASHLANQITSTVGKIAGNVNINRGQEPQILLVESNATTGFSGGALINPKSKGLVGLVSWITAGDVAGKYTVAIFRDFLRNLMIQDLNFDLKLTQNQ